MSSSHICSKLIRWQCLALRGLGLQENVFSNIWWRAAPVLNSSRYVSEQVRGVGEQVGKEAVVRKAWELLETRQRKGGGAHRVLSGGDQVSTVDHTTNSSYSPSNLLFGWNRHPSALKTGTKCMKTPQQAFYPEGWFINSQVIILICVSFSVRGSNERLLRLLGKYSSLAPGCCKSFPWTIRK